MNHATPIIYPTFALLLCAFVFILTRYLNLLERHRRGKANYQLIADRAKAIMAAIEQYLPQLKVLKGESFVAGLKTALFDLIEVKGAYTSIDPKLPRQIKAERGPGGDSSPLSPLEAP